MAPKVKGRELKEAKRDERRKLGTLKCNLVTSTTKQRYDFSLHRFFIYCDRLGFTQFHSITHINAVIVGYLEELWSEGDPLSWGQETVAALELEVANLKGSLREPKRYLKCWEKLELPTKATPILRPVVHAMAYFALEDGQQRLALIMVLAHSLCLRTSELLALRFSDLTISPACASLVAYLGQSKTGKRKNKSECARCKDKALILFAKALCPDDAMGDYILDMSEATFRKKFAQLAKRVGLDPERVKPYSLRRGGATQHFRDGWSFGAISELGRWGSEAACREYINDAGAELALLQLAEKAHLSIAVASTAFLSAIS
jgi:hypothetical protein